MYIKKSRKSKNSLSNDLAYLKFPKNEILKTTWSYNRDHKVLSNYLGIALLVPFSTKK